MEEKKETVKKNYIKEFLPYFMIILVVVLIKTFVVSPIRVNGASMDPTLNDKDIMLLDEISYRFSDIERFDIVVVKEEDEYLIKRVIGLPGDTISIQNNKVYINGEVYIENYLEEGLVYDDFELSSLGYDVIPDDMYLVLGDNRPDSVDSREIGLISKDDVIGKISFRIWPLNKLAAF